MKSIALLTCTVAAVSIIHAADSIPVKPSDVPANVRGAVAKLAKGAETSFKRFDGPASKPAWKATFAQDGKRESLLVSCEAVVVNGVTNIAVRYIMPLKPEP